MPQIQLDGRTITYTVRRSGRARSVRLRITPHAGLEVVLPTGVNGLDIEGLLRERAAWILKHTARMPSPETGRAFTAGARLPFLGRDYTLEVITRPHGRPSVVQQADRLVVRLPAPAAPDEVRAVLESWYRAQARRYLTARAAELARQHGFTYQRIAIKDQRTRWGSCSSRGNLNFNWRLMLAPPAAIDYVIVHELCHLHEMNHSRRFWTLVGRCCPDYRRWVKWFKLNGASLRW